MSFENLALHSTLHKAIALCGYKNPTPIQEKSIPVILAGKDLVASAATGTGKTAAFVLPALEQLTKQTQQRKTRILILTPTRELANQITQAVILYGKFLKFNVVNLVGGMPYHQQIRALSRGADIIVATPGRLLDHQENHRLNLQHIDMLVLDEADRMLDMGFIDDVRTIAKLTSAKRQTLLFSATVDKKLKPIVRDLLHEPIYVDLTEKAIAAPSIKQLFYKTTNAQHKMRLLKSMISDNQIYKAIIFSATKINADKLSYWLQAEGISSAPLHGDLKQRIRNRTIEQFRQNKVQFLIATDVAARGIDIDDITHVINYDLPRFCEDYVHRIGRTGRAGRDGIAISFVMPADMKHLQRIERYIGTRLPLKHMDAEGEVITMPPKKEERVKKAMPHRKREGMKAMSYKKDERGAKSNPHQKRKRPSNKTWGGKRQKRHSS